MEQKIIWCDTRQKPEKWDWLKIEFANRGYKIKDDKPMTYGDYCMPPNLSLLVDTKHDIQELISNVCSKDHRRFKDELVGAMEMNAKLYILILDNYVKCIDDLNKWQNPRLKYYNFEKARALKKGIEFKKKPPTSGATLAKALKTMQEEYKCEFLFCTQNQVANKIIELLEGEKND